MPSGQPNDGEAWRRQAETGSGEANADEQGDSFWSIARRHDVSLDEFLELNGFSRATNIYTGQSVLIPASSKGVLVSPSSMSDNDSGEIHIVRPGDTLSQIARRYSITITALKTLNRLDTDAVQAC